MLFVVLDGCSVTDLVHTAVYAAT